MFCNINLRFKFRYCRAIVIKLSKTIPLCYRLENLFGQKNPMISTPIWKGLCPKIYIFGLQGVGTFEKMFPNSFMVEQTVTGI